MITSFLRLEQELGKISSAVAQLVERPSKSPGWCNNPISMGATQLRRVRIPAAPKGCRKKIVGIK